jgi:murein DD-endopeptidase MepM/ murein hydrolase activator NlpD
MNPSWKISLLPFLIASAIASLSPSPVLATASTPTTPADQSNAKEAEELCGKPTLDDLAQHKVKQGETLESIAKQYELKTATLMGLNPEVRNGGVQAGQTLSIPPLDGLTYRFKNEENYTTVAKKYNIRADVLFERNGCQRKPKVVFVPGAIWKPDPVPFNPAIASRGSANPDVIFQTGGYPLPYAVPVTSNYGWRMNPVTTIWSFHSGIDLGASFGTPVLATSSDILYSTAISFLIFVFT